MEIAPGATFGGGNLAMQVILANISGKVRKSIRNGREYAVAPLVMLVEGVLNGSKGALMYPLAEMELSVNDWNDTPIVVHHPEKNGQPVSGRDPGVLDERKIGRVYNARIDKNRLVADGWFDVEATKRVDSRILKSLRSGKPIELSTGLFTDNEPKSGVHNGRKYDQIARRYVADHLAILPDKVGACSVSDGCGVLVNDENRNVKRFAELLSASAT